MPRTVLDILLENPNNQGQDRQAALRETYRLALSRPTDAPGSAQRRDAAIEMLGAEIQKLEQPQRREIQTMYTQMSQEFIDRAVAKNEADRPNADSRHQMAIMRRIMTSAGIIGSGVRLPQQPQAIQGFPAEGGFRFQRDLENFPGIWNFQGASQPQSIGDIVSGVGGVFGGLINSFMPATPPANATPNTPQPGDILPTVPVPPLPPEAPMPVRPSTRRPGL